MFSWSLLSRYFTWIPLAPKTLSMMFQELGQDSCQLRLFGWSQHLLTVNCPRGEVINQGLHFIPNNTALNLDIHANVNHKLHGTVFGAGSVTSSYLPTLFYIKRVAFLTMYLSINPSSSCCWKLSGKYTGDNRLVSGAKQQNRYTLSDLHWKLANPF